MYLECPAFDCDAGDCGSTLVDGECVNDGGGGGGGEAAVVMVTVIVLEIVAI